MAAVFEPDCRRCPRLAEFLDQVKAEYPQYHAKPVAPFGSTQPRLLVVGLAPGMHGANATGRPFTGDYAGELLYATLHKFGFSNQPVSTHLNDGLELLDCRITNAVKCLPPQNKPVGAEIRECNRFLSQELGQQQAGDVILALGKIAHDAVLRALGLRLADYPFGHAVEYTLPNRMVLLSSYHCSRYNTQTRRLTPAMFEAVFERARHYLDD